jgi:hypothetical protein
MTRWIEIADERHFCETAMFDRTTQIVEPPRPHLGTALCRLPSRVLGALSHRSVGSRSR